MAGTAMYTEDWQTLSWKEIERAVFRLQKRIYQAASEDDVKRVPNLHIWADWGHHLRAMDVLEVHHRDGNPANQTYQNLALLHGHCHDFVHH